MAFWKRPIITNTGILEWESAPTPTGRVSLPTDVQLIGQAIEYGIINRGRMSCYLTSYLNALILRGYFKTDEAHATQKALSTHPAYDKYWIDSPVQVQFGANTFTIDQQAWRNSYTATAKAIREITGRVVQVSQYGSTELPALLDEGYIAQLNDTNHTYTAFIPQEPATPYIHDPWDGSLESRDPSNLHTLRSVTVF